MGKGFPYFLVIVALSGVLGRLVGFFIPVYFKSIGLTPTQTGLYFAVSSIASIILSLPMGISTDRVKIAWLLTASFLLAALSYLGLIFTETFWVFCTFALAGSFAGRLYTIANNTFFFKTAGDDSRRATGIYQFVMFASIGLGMWLGGMLIDRFTFRFVFVLSLLGNLALMAFSCFLPHNATVEITLDEYRKSVWTPRVLLICAVFFLSSLHYGAEMVSYSPFLKDVLHLSISASALYISAGFVIVGLGSYLGSVLLEKRIVHSVERLLAIGFLSSGICHALMCVHNVALSFAFRAVHELGDGFIFLAYFHGIARTFHVDRIGGCSSFISLWTALGAFVSSIAFGVIDQRFGHQWPLIISGVVMACIPLLLRLANRTVYEC